MLFWNELDCGAYIGIADEWYTNVGPILQVRRIVFYPGFPVLVKLVSSLLNSSLQSSLIVSVLCYAFAGTELYKLLRLDFTPQQSARGIKFFLIVPGAFFLVCPMSDGLFLLLCLLCMRLAREKKHLWACIAGAYAAFTRSLGILLLAPVLTEMIHEFSCSHNKRYAWRIFLYALIIPLGFFSYLLINLSVFGDAFAFAYYEEICWGQSFCFFVEPVSKMPELIPYMLKMDWPIAVGCWLPNTVFCFGVLFLFMLTANKLRVSYTAWFIVYYAVAMGVTKLISGPRYLLGFAALLPAIVLVTEKKWINILLTVVFPIAAILYFYPLVNVWSVY